MGETISKEKHRKIAADLYGRLDKAVQALEKATTSAAEDKAEDRIAKLEAKIAELAEDITSKDEDVCPVCKGDLRYVEEGIVYCPACEEYYEWEEN